MFSQHKLLLALCLCVSVEGHGFLARPVSRNAVGKSSNGKCTWSGAVPCFGDFMSLGGTDGPDATGCTNSGGRGGVTGTSGLSFYNTEVITSYGKGSIIDVEVDITAYHGGKFEFRVQDVGSSNDPDGSKWATSTPLPVLSMSPECGSACPVKEPCAPGSNGAGTCAQIPLTKGDHNGHYNIRVQLPADLQCEHCVMQWHWTSSNSCPGGLACSGSEQFWNCADIRITGDGSNPSPTPGTSTPATPTPSSTPAPPPTEDESVERYCPTTTFTQQSGGESCTGRVGNGCNAGGELFVKDFVASCNGSAQCQKACPVVAAIAWQESKWASTARSWDWGGCGATNALGAYGVLQFDMASGLNPLPMTPTEQLIALKGFSSDYTSFTQWAACSHINPAGSGWVQAMDDVMAKATAWCTTETGLAASDFGSATDYGCGVPAATNCPDGLSPFADTPMAGVCSCGTDWADANTGGITCTAGPTTSTPAPPTTNPSTPAPTPTSTTAPSAGDCNDFTTRCQNACTIQSGGVSTNQCYGSPLFTQCTCSDGSKFHFAGFKCDHPDCPSCGSPVTPANSPAPTPGPTADTSGPTTPFQCPSGSYIRNGSALSFADCECNWGLVRDDMNGQCLTQRRKLRGA